MAAKPGQGGFSAGLSMVRHHKVSAMTEAAGQVWAQGIYQVLKAENVRQVAYVPDAGHATLIDLCAADEAMRSVPLTTEEEGIALLAGAWLGGQRGVLLMQSSGVGNCINMLSLSRTCRFPLLMLVTMRGEWGEFNPWQVPMGRMTGAMLEGADVMVFRAEDRDTVADEVAAAARMSLGANGIAAVLIAQTLIGSKTFGK